jgi:hypothetical protein
VGREFSKPRLEQRLGPFEAAPGQQVSREPARRYQKQPLASNVDTTELYARYRTAQAVALETRAREREQARARKERRIEAAKRSVRLKRAALRLASMPRPAKKLVYSALAHALGEEITATRDLYRRERQAIDRQHRRYQWTDWLRREAEMGDLQALASLRARHQGGGLAGNTVTGAALPQRHVQPSGHDSITKAGTIIYRVGTGAIRDDGGRLKVSLGADQAAVQCALRMAIARYGARIAVNGSDAFRQQVLIAAVAEGLRITFADAALEQRRLQLIRLSPAEGGTDPTRVMQGLKPGATRSGNKTPYHGDPAATDGRGSASEAAARYVAEREQTRVNGFDIPKHARYTSLNAGAATYAGTRRVDGQALALLKQGDRLMVLEVDAATARRLKRLPLGAQVSVNAHGVIKAKGRSR